MKSKWLNDLMRVTNCDFCSIQEHFKKNVGSYFSKKFPEYYSYITPAVREAERDVGRAQGGLAQLHNAMINIKTERVKTKSFRLQAQVLHFSNMKLLWINSYFPTDSQAQNFNDDELSAVLVEAEEILDHVEYDHVLWGGDLNCDPNRNSGFAQMVGDFMNRVGLYSAWEKYPVSHTHVHTDLVSTSTLDHFMVDKELLGVVEDAGAMNNLGDNRSRHSPIMIKLNLGNIPSRKAEHTKSKPRRPAWYKAGELEKEAFKNQLEARLEALETPNCLNCMNPSCKDDTHSEERDGHMMDIMGALIECSHENIPMVGGDSRSQKEPQVMPGWKETVEPCREKAVFWHSVWQSCGRPARGEVKNIMAKTRNRYHYAVRKCKKMIDSTRARKLLEASQEGPVNLLKELKKT